jgi:hypothetical protein
MRIDSSGNVGIGTTSPLGRLHITNPSGVPAIYFDGGNSDIGYASAGVLQFGEYDGSTYTERMRIDSSGNLLVSTTQPAQAGNTADASAGIALLADNSYQQSRSGVNMYLNRLGSNGDIVSFRKDGAPVGSIGTRNGYLHIRTDAGTNGSGIRFSDGYVMPCASDGSNSDATTDLGLSSSRFKDLYLSGGIVLDDNPTAVGGSVTSKTLDDYEEGTYTPTLQFGTSVSYTSQTGYYTKVGNLVYVEAIIDATFSADSSAVHISLPFAPVGNDRAALCNYDTDDSTMFTYAAANSTPLGGQMSGSAFRVTAADGDYLLYNEAQSGKISVALTYRIR